MIAGDDDADFLESLLIGGFEDGFADLGRQGGGGALIGEGDADVAEIVDHPG